LALVKPGAVGKQQAGSYTETHKTFACDRFDSCCLQSPGQGKLEGIDLSSIQPLARIDPNASPTNHDRLQKFFLASFQDGSRPCESPKVAPKGQGDKE